MLTRSGARLVIADRRMAALLAPALSHARPALGLRAVAEIIALAGDRSEPSEVDADGLALVQFSSGSTVEPKPVALTHRQILANVDAVQQALLAAHPEHDGLRHRCVSWLPLYHDMGLIGCLLASVAHGAELVLLPPELFVARPGAWLRAISAHRGTVTAAPNFAYALCVERVTDAELEALDLSSLRVALCGAEPVVPEVLERFADRFARCGLRPEALTPVYGLSEAALAVTFSQVSTPVDAPSFDAEALAERGRAIERPGGRRVVSLGRPLPGYRVRVVDERGRDCPDRVVGRVLAAGPSLMQGYLGDAQATTRALAGGWLDTGDTGFLRGGELFLYGRAKDLLVLRGRKYAPQLVEEAAQEVAGVRKGCVVAATTLLPGRDQGESLVVLVERTRDGRQRASELALAVRRHVLQQTGLAPQRVEVLAPGCLPRTSSGKLRRHEALRRWLAGSLRPPHRFVRLRLVVALARARLGAGLRALAAP
jgi:acyl-CoA synthetase (AMP-forming)/AMP-acid ligase II